MSYTIIHHKGMIDSIGENKTKNILSTFSCHPEAPGVEQFLKDKAVLFANQGWAQTHLITASHKKNHVIVGYFTLANKVITVPTKNLSKTTQKRIAKFATYDNELKAYCLSAPLIAQLGKNYTNGYNALITGDELLSIACKKVSQIQMDLGGRYVYLECDDMPALVSFYARNGFVEFDKRQLEKDELDLFTSKYLVQMLKHIR
jgi:hypothetical protein